MTGRQLQEGASAVVEMRAGSYSRFRDGLPRKRSTGGLASTRLPESSALVQSRAPKALKSPKAKGGVDPGFLDSVFGGKAASAAAASQHGKSASSACAARSVADEAKAAARARARELRKRQREPRALGTRPRPGAIALGGR